MVIPWQFRRLFLRISVSLTPLSMTYINALFSVQPLNFFHYHLCIWSLYCERVTFENTRVLCRKLIDTHPKTSLNNFSHFPFSRHTQVCFVLLSIRINDSLYTPLVVPNCTEVNDEMKFLLTYSPSQMEHTSTCLQVIFKLHHSGDYL